MTEETGKMGSNLKGKGGLIWYAHGSKENEITVAGEYGYGKSKKLSFSLGQQTAVFQAEMCAVKACVVENIHNLYKNRNIYIQSDSQASIKGHLSVTRSAQNKSGTCETG
jgi:hypothetical protein